MPRSNKKTQPSFLITAGPTREYLDPVRFISNPSTGKMGIALAEAAVKKGAKVTLCLSNFLDSLSIGIRTKGFVTAKDLLALVLSEITNHDILIMTAAVSDYRPKKFSYHKKKKTLEKITLELTRSPDILKTISNKIIREKKECFLVGFAAETNNLNEFARKKLIEKKIHMIIANHVYMEKKGFNSDTNNVKIFTHEKKNAIASFKGNKKTISKNILELIIKKYNEFIIT